MIITEKRRIVMTILENSQCYRRNLALIEVIYPHYGAALSKFPLDDRKYEIAQLAPNTYTCKINPVSNQWIHGPGDPWQWSQSVIKSSDWQTSSTFVIARPGLGYIPFTLYPNLRKGRHAQRMLLVEDRLDLFKLSLYLFDWTDVLRSDRTILVLNANPTQAIIDFFKLNPVAILPPILLQAGGPWGEEEHRMMETLQNELAMLSKTVHGAAHQYIQELHTHYQNRSTGKNESLKVLFVEPEHDYLAPPIAEGFKQENCRVETFTGNRRLLNFLNPYLWLVYTREHFPDVLLWMNRNTLSAQGAEILASMPVKKVLWFLDSPQRVQTSKEELDATDFYFSFDASYLPMLKSLCGKEGYYLPTAAGVNPLPECEPGKDWPERLGPPAGFLGALGAQRFQDVREFWLRRDPEFVRILDEIVEAYLDDPGKTLEERFNESPGRERLPYSGFVVLYLEERTTYLHRLRHLKTVSGMGLKTYGAKEWSHPEWAEELAPLYSGEFPNYDRDAARVYYNTQINVNVFHVQCVNASNPRVYDVLAAGGFLLTEYKPVLEEEFKINEHLVCFTTKEELREKTEYYLQHPDEREAIARAGQEYVLNHATYRHRIQHMLSIVMNRDS